MKEEYINEIITIIRKYKPTLVFAPYLEDRHPDHGNCARLSRRGGFFSGDSKVYGE